MERQEIPEALNEAQQKLVIDNYTYAKRQAQQFFFSHVGYGIEQADFEGAAMLGLCGAASRYDTKKKVPFRTYCLFRIRGEMYDLLRFEGLGIKRRTYVKMSKEALRYARNCDKPLEYIKEELDDEAFEAFEEGEGSTSAARHTFAKNAQDLAYQINCSDALNLHLHVRDGGKRVALSYANQETPETVTEIRSEARYLHRLINDLPPRECEIVKMRYFSGRTFDEVRFALGGKSRSWMARYHRIALSKIQEELEGSDYERPEIPPYYMQQIAA